MLTKKSWKNKKVTIKNSKIEGKGAFANSDIVKEEKVFIFGGNYANKQEAEQQKKNGKLIMQWDENLFSYEDRGNDDSYFINHSCDSNLWMKDAYTLVARKNIKKDEELTADYALWEADKNFIAQWDCHCHSTFCRTKITGKDWQIPELQTRYKNHFSPLINKKIKNL